ncbi:MAG TPA: Ppx/GppA family phosphatase [Tenuifilaceae bacterium]|nr:Ppx/GppA family phosphatase [Tenuifilaceae bacterium]
MIKVLKFAAIDIGSNAARLLLTNVVEEGSSAVFRKSSLVRMPLRLGEDSFSTGVLSERRIDKLVKTMIAYRNLMEVEDVVAYKACATSAMREAKNSKEVVDYVLEKSGIDIEIIDGKREAEIIYSNEIVEMLNDSNPYIYMDVGGGSTEITLFENKMNVISRSFDIGTIRLLKEKVSDETVEEMKQWVKDLGVKKRNPKIIGSGGNINKIYKLSGKTENAPLLYSEFKELYKFLQYYTVDERIKILGMNPDRADVIIPASKIYLKVMKWAGAKQVIVPTIGVSDGIVHMLYREYKSQGK